MYKHRDNPTLDIKSGNKFVTANGIIAIKDGIKFDQNNVKSRQEKPKWLRIKVQNSQNFNKVKSIVHDHRLTTVCEEAICPNISECWSAGTATIMLLGDVCTRACQFCAVNTGNPNGWIDNNEIENVSLTVVQMGLKYVVLTSVNRDDLTDGGASHFAAVVKRINEVSPSTAVEALTPDFQGHFKQIEVIIDCGIVVFAQNIETVERLTNRVRDRRAGFQQTLSVLEHAKRYRPDILTKTSLMLGLGETDEELIATMDALRAVNVDILTLGQYLQPTLNHLAVKRYVPPQDFARYRAIGIKKGFLEVVSGPLVRSSYRAEHVLLKNNVGLV